MCRQPGPVGEEKRRLWGCDGEAPAPLGFMECPTCRGLAHGCPDCQGAGRQPVLRCPWAVAVPASQPALGLAIEAAEHGSWPVSGGVLAQAAAFVDAVRVVRQELAKVRQEAMETR